MYSSRIVIIGLSVVVLMTATTMIVMTSRGTSSLAHAVSAMSDRFIATFQQTVRNSNDVIATNVIIQQLLRQRDDLSSAMRQLSMEHHQLQCKLGADSQISSHGGWCINSSKHFTDRSLASALIDLFQGQTVGSFGDGYGGYKQIIDQSGKVDLYDSYDGAPFCENQTNGLVKYLDLSIPVFGLRLYDWIMSLEVGEHIPKEYEQIFLDNIVRHAKGGVVLSWAVPGQGGHGHINAHTLEYIEQQLDNRGFYRDRQGSMEIQNASSISWIKSNINIYKHKTGHDVDILNM